MVKKVPRHAADPELLDAGYARAEDDANNQNAGQHSKVDRSDDGIGDRVRNVITA